MDVKSYKVKFKGYVFQVVIIVEKRFLLIFCNLDRKDIWNFVLNVVYCYGKGAYLEILDWFCVL